MADQEFHKLYPEEFENARLEAAGALIGWMLGKTGEGPYWSEAMHEGFLYAAAEAFNAGVKVGREMDQP